MNQSFFILHLNAASLDTLPCLSTAASPETTLRDIIQKEPLEGWRIQGTNKIGNQSTRTHSQLASAPITGVLEVDVDRVLEVAAELF